MVLMYTGCGARACIAYAKEREKRSTAMGRCRRVIVAVFELVEREVQPD